MYLKDGVLDDVVLEVGRKLIEIYSLNDVKDIKRGLSELIYAIHFSENMTGNVISGIPIDDEEE